MHDASRDYLQLFLHRLIIRSRFCDQEMQAILDLPTDAVKVAANQDFVCLGEVVDHACLIVEGIAGRFGQTEDGVRQITAFYFPGDMADLHSVVQPRVGSALQALTKTTILRISHSALRGVAARYPAVAEAFWRDCMVDAAVLSQWVVNVGRRDARAGMAHLLCEIATRLGLGTGSHAPDFAFSVTQAQLADATGLSTVHVNRTLKALAGIVTVARGSVQIHDWDRLAAVGEFEADYLQIDVVPAEPLKVIQPI